MDALPYVDVFPEAYEQYALALIEEEMQNGNQLEDVGAYKIRPSSTRQPHHTATASTATSDRGRVERSELFKCEIERLEKAKSTSKTSSDETDRASRRAEGGSDKAGRTDQLPLRPTSVFDEPPDEANLNEWRRAVRRARIEHETERIRSVILAVEKDEQSAVWKDWNAARQRALERLSTSVLASEQQAVEAINLERQRDQIHKGERLQILAAQYHELVDKLDRLRRATAELSSGSSAGAIK
jgi:hypothetical protein